MWRKMWGRKYRKFGEEGEQEGGGDVEEKVEKIKENIWRSKWWRR